MDLLVYLAKVSCLLSLFWVIYKVFLETETYHRSKRIYLHLGYVLSLILPLLTYTKIEEITLTPSFLGPSSSEVVPAEIKLTNLELIQSFIVENGIIEILYISISAVFVIHFMLKFYKLLSFLRSSKAFQTEGIIHIKKSIPEGAFSFLNYIVYNPELYSEAELKIILAHEKAHVLHKHSLDILFAHVYNCLFWFNPFAWLYQRSLILNLEYEADAQVVDYTAKKDYQMTLYSISQQQFRSQLHHSFHQSPIKKRIAMLNQNKKQSFWKLFLVSPLLVVFFLLFQVETKAQLIEAESTSEVEMNKIEITFDEMTTKEDLESTKEFLKEDFDINMTYSNFDFKPNGDMKSLSIKVISGNLFEDSASSSDLSKNPIHFFRDFSEDTDTPFGVSVKPKRASEDDAQKGNKAIKNTENFIINGNKISKEKLAKTYIPVDTYSYEEKSKTLSIKTRPEFSKPFFSNVSDITKELIDKFGKNITEEMTFIKVSSDHEPILISLTNFKISEGSDSIKSENTSSSHSSSKNLPSTETVSDNIRNAENFIINGKKVNKEELAGQYIPFEDFIYDKTSKTLSITTRSEFSEIYYPEISRAASELFKKSGKNITEDINFININSDYEVASVILNRYKVSTNSTAFTKPENMSLSYTSSKPKRTFLDPESKYKIQDMIIFVDGVKAERGEAVNINPDEIESVVTLKSPEELKAEGYNSNFIKGIIKITTKKGKDVNASQDDNQNYRSSLNNNQNVIFLIDGKEVESDQLNKIQPKDIESTVVVKSPTDLKNAGYDPRKVDGLIKITTKKETFINDSQRKNHNTLQKTAFAKNNDKLIYKVDGKKVDEKEFYELTPEQVKSMVIIKSPDNLKRNGYDPKKIDGVIQISTKKNDSEGDGKIKIK